MSSISSFVLESWTPSNIPATTTSTYINPTHLSSLTLVLASATSALVTATKEADLYSISEVIRGAEASITVIQAENVLSTATVSLAEALASAAYWAAAVNLQELALDQNNYLEWIKYAPNAIFTALFGLLLIIHFGYMVWLKFIYFGICMFFGIGCEFAGYLARTLAVSDTANSNYFLCQIICLTIAPAFIMASIYYTLGKLIVVHGRNYSILKPVFYGYIFIFCDVLSLVIQAIGGGMAAVASLSYENPDNGTHVMVAGIAFQVVSMTLFYGFFFDFLYRINFKASPEVKFTFANLIKIFNFGPSSQRLRVEKLEPFYDQEYRHLRDKKLFRYFPIAVTLATTFIYIRCVYRVVELAQGWSGNLITHEVYLMCLDALMVFLTCFLFVIIHPLVFLGIGERLPLRNRTKRKLDKENQISDEFSEKVSGEGEQNSFQGQLKDL